MANASLADHKFYVYVHSRLSSGEPFYVGKGSDTRAYDKVRRNTLWKRIVAKDGGRFLNYIVKNVDEELAFLVEEEMIDKYRQLEVKLANFTDGGEGMSGYRFTDEQRARRSELKKGNKNNLGRKATPEIRAKMSAAQRARTVWPKLTEERKAKISEFQKGNKWRLGKKASDETRKKLSLAKKGKQYSLGRILTEQHKAKLSEAHKNRTKEEREIISKKLSESTKRIWALRKQTAA